MRRRTALWAGAALTLCALVQAPAQAAPVLPVSPTAPAAAARSAHAVDAAGRTLTLVTGQRVHLVGAPGHERVVVGPARTAGESLVVRRNGSHLYVYPVGIEPLLGRSVDLALFDLHGAGADARGRTAVRVSYSGRRPDVPGLHVSSAAGGVADGYVPASSARAFGAALLRQASAVRAGSAASLGGADRISAARTAAATSDRRFPMKTLVIKVLGANGKPQADGLLFLLSVDDGGKFGGPVFVEQGEARVSVPAGTYSAISDDFVDGKTEDTGSLSITTVNEYDVTGAGQTLTIDHRTATVTPAVRAPRPTTPTSLYLEWDRVDADDSASFGSGYFIDPGLAVKVAPSAPARVGTLALLQSWTVEQRAAKPAEVYSLASLDDHIPAQPHSFRAGDVAKIRSTYDGDGSGAVGGFSRSPVFTDTGGGGTIDRVARGTSRTEYAGATGEPAQWADTMLTSYDSEDDPGFFDRDARPLPAGSSTSEVWFRGPLGAGVPSQTSSEDQGAFCYGCRSGNALSVGLAPITDSDPYHYGELFGSGTGLPVARFRLYRGSKLIDDEDDATGAYVKVSAKKRTYTAVVDVDRRASDPRLSTQSRTELTFSSARNKGAKLPKDWFCDGDKCRVLPLLQARTTLATDHQGQLPLGRSTVTVRVAQVQNAKTSAVVSAGLEYRPAGRDWIGVDLRRVSEGVYTGVIDDRDDPGTVADLRVSATDKAGSAYRQTVARAFSVAAK